MTDNFDFLAEVRVTRRIPKWLLVAAALLLPACSSDTAVFGPAGETETRVPTAAGLRQDIPRPDRIDAVVPGDPEAAEQTEVKGRARFSRYAMAAS